MNSDGCQHIHIIGIGGIGVSALARYYLADGARISGSDLQSSEITDGLLQAGVTIAIGKHRAANIPKDATLVVYTAAAAKDNLELKTAKKRGITVKSYAEAISELTKKYRTITVSGSHGKSTTTALAALVLQESFFDPTVIVGTKLKEFNDTNFRHGRGAYLVLEADEYNRSFLNYSPEIAVVTNIDAEHLDTYGSVEGVERAFHEYMEKIPRHGKIIANEDDKRLHNVAKKFGLNVIWYSLKDPEAPLIRQMLKIPGEHNVSNALAAMKLGRLLGAQDADILRALGNFTGAWRRFEFKGLVNGAYLFTDYGHHPREIFATIAAARERFPFRRIFCIYQPHQRARLQYLWDEFAGAFDMADQVGLLPVYDVAGREGGDKDRTATSRRLAIALTKRGKDAHHLASFASAKKFISANTRAGDIVLMMGAGTIYDLVCDIAAG